MKTKPIKLKPQIIGESGPHAYRAILPCKKELILTKAIDFVEQVEVTISFFSNNRGSIEIILEKGDVKSVLAEKRNDRHGGLTTWTYTSVRHWGSKSKVGDKWIVHMNTRAGYGSQLRGISIKVHGM